MNKKTSRRRQPVPARWPSLHEDPTHFNEVSDFLTSDPVTADELRRMAVSTGGAQAARIRGIDRASPKK
jgi:hypothetical protein